MILKMDVFPGLFLLLLTFFSSFKEYEASNGTVPGSFGNVHFRIEKNPKTKKLHIRFDRPNPFGSDNVVTVTLGCDNLPEVQKNYTTQNITGARITIDEPCVEILRCSIQASNSVGNGIKLVKLFQINAKCESPPESLSKEIIIAIGLSGGLVLIFILGLFMCKKWRIDETRKQKEWMEQIMNANRKGDESWQPFTPQNMYVDASEVAEAVLTALKQGRLMQFDKQTEHIYDEIKFTNYEYPREKLKLLKRIGEGNFGCVYKAEAENIKGSHGKSTVAVKVLKDNAKDKDKEEFLEELELMKQLPYHPNVVHFLGCCTKKGEPLIIVEFLPCGDLLDILRRPESQKSSNSFLHESDFINFALDIARGMGHLHACKVLHRDLACRNVLIANNGRCKVSDLGLARFVGENRTYQSVSERLPIKWMAPESIFYRTFSYKTDIWSFGITLWEIITKGEKPYPGHTGREVGALLDRGVRLPRPFHCSEELYRLMAQCWQDEPSSRPSFRQLEYLLMEMRKESNKYLNMSYYQENDYGQSRGRSIYSAGPYEVNRTDFNWRM
ncbi:tyrosine kinase receptor Cad96Ca-like [Hydractinia symbiolongicarpus]|uniref:tyrosine kinase receptor Cad96Ca-like n=1 Tax=Hydractinia symbiolongicarpus TaxID=13093 RepID=UPI00254B5CA6|nr:tyrosine kinase receptor Cad96Ca-like [Hydractinia symbiolongicarpus]